MEDMVQELQRDLAEVDALYERAKALDGTNLEDFPKDLLLDMAVNESLDPADDRAPVRLCNILWSAPGRDGFGISRCWLFALDCGEAQEGDPVAEPEAVFLEARSSHQWLNGFSVASMMSGNIRRIVAALDGQEIEASPFENNLKSGLQSRAEYGPWFAHNGRRYVFFTCNCS
jgi:hypothetical protein